MRVWRTCLHTVFVCVRLEKPDHVCAWCVYKLWRAARARQNSSTCVAVSDCGCAGISQRPPPPTHTQFEIWKKKVKLYRYKYKYIYTKLIFWSVFSFFKYCGTSCALFLKKRNKKEKKLPFFSMSLFGLSFLFDYLFFLFGSLDFFCSALWNHKLVLIILPDCVLCFDFSKWIYPFAPKGKTKTSHLSSFKTSQRKLCQMWA